MIVPNEQQVKNEENLVEESQSIDLVKIEVEAEELTLDDSVELEVLEENQNVEQNQDVEENNENSV
ncbi:MAG: hypothetical protein LBQ24_05870 [Candidatus Peribacteria bacterium]|nr:hypothetical protein [Candidatus Peribacteria bacterium]